MLILGIESSCDDTSVALVDCSENGHTILALKTAFQIDIHKLYGGVVPEIAGRLHAEAIVPLIEEVLNASGKNKVERVKPDVIAVTSGPGLITSLLVGVEAARTLSYAWNIPLVSVNHLDGHIHSVELKNSQSQYPISNIQYSSLIQFPSLALIVSGGHTELVLLKNHGDYTLLGATVDDAAGECFDKVAKILNLEYPGGPKISKLAESGNTQAINFPRPILKDPNYNFSFSGLKTSALYWLRDNKLSAAHLQPLTQPAGIFGVQPEQPTIEDFCASIEQAIVDVLVTKTLRAVAEFNPTQVLLVGGVAANSKLRTTLAEQIALHHPTSDFRTPASEFCMDNGAMIAVAGYYQALKNNFTAWDKLEANSNWKIA